jgi:ABC-type bacteriocin/lantibiotic exporter with double-glycine peptidase domain
VLSIADIFSLALVLLTIQFYAENLNAAFADIFPKLSSLYFLPALLLILVFVLKSVAAYFIIRKQSGYIWNIAGTISKEKLHNYLNGAYADHVTIDSAVWVRRILFQPIEFVQYVLYSAMQIINEVILIVCTITALAIYNMQLLFIVVLVLFPASIFILNISRRKLKHATHCIKESNEQTLQYLHEAIAGFVESNFYEKNNFFMRRYSTSLSKLNRFIAEMQIAQTMPSRFFEVFSIVGLFIMIIAMHYTGHNSSETAIMLGAFIAAAYKIIPGISKVINYCNLFKAYMFTIDELAEKAETISISNSLALKENVHTISLKEINFSYKQHTIFTQFSCRIPAKSVTAISGRSGIGKTTLIDILLGLIKPENGRILFNEKNISFDDMRSYWHQFSYVKQTGFLLHDSILNNILFDNERDNERLEEILEITGLNCWLHELPQGMHTVITEAGKNISGGQKQRIVLARALYKNAPVLILDEPFNELDKTSETILLQHLQTLARKGKTIILITHNTHSFNFCDHVIYLDED